MPSDGIGLPLSAAQRGIWFAQKLGQGASNYNLGGWTEIDGPVDPNLFETAIGQAIFDAETLRVRFVENGEGPLQIIDPGFEAPLPLFDLSSRSDPAVAAEEWMKADLTETAEVSRGFSFPRLNFRQYGLPHRRQVRPRSKGTCDAPSIMSIPMC